LIGKKTFIGGKKSRAKNFSGYQNYLHLQNVSVAKIKE
jgi:hypothetical protein